MEGASDLIRGQLQRGDAHEHLRIKCWKHIVIELSALVEDDSAPSNGAATVMNGRYAVCTKEICRGQSLCFSLYCMPAARAYPSAALCVFLHIYFLPCLDRGSHQATVN